MSTVYITREDSGLYKKGERLIVKQGRKKVGDIPLVKVDQVVVFGNASISGPLISLLLKADVPIAYLSYYGKYKGRLVPEYSKNSLLRIKQFEAYGDKEFCLDFAKKVVWGKLMNMRTLILRDTREDRSEKVQKITDKFKNLIDKLYRIKDVDKLRGHEGLGSRYYFSVLNSLLDEEFDFKKRNRRPPRDPINSMLSFGYTLLFNDVLSALYLVGFDPYIGFFHSSQYGKPALALDLMEEFRPIIVDSVVKLMINKGMVKKEGFKNNHGSIEMSEKVRNIFLEQYEKRLRTEFTHPIFDYKITWRRCLELQARLIAKNVLGEIEEYPPLVVK